MFTIAMSPVMSFVHQEERTFYGWFRQNSLLRLEPGSEAEVTLDGIPGVIFKGEVREVLPVIGEGQLKPGAEFLRRAVHPMNLASGSSHAVGVPGVLASVAS